MKAIMILIVVAGTAHGTTDGPDQTLQVKEIEFSTLKSCQKAAAQLTDAGRKNVYWAREFSADKSNRQRPVPAPVVMAECVKT